MRSGYVIFTYLSLFIFGLIDNSRGPIYPKVIEVFGLTKSLSSWIFTLTSIITFTVTMASPVWLKRFGAINATKAAMIFHAASLLCMGFSSLDGEGFWLFLMGSVFLGFAMGIQNLTVNMIIAKVSTPYNGSRLFSGLHSMYGAASLIVPLALGAVFKFGISWQWVIAAMSLIPLAHFFYFKKLEPLNVTGEQSEHGPVSRTLLLKLGIFISFYVAAEILISSRLVVYLVEIGQFKIDNASFGLTGFFILLLGGRLLMTFYVPPFKKINMLLFSIIGTLLLYLASLFISPGFLILTGATMSFFFPFSMDFIKASYPQADAIIPKVMMFVGGMIAGMHFLFGIISDAFGLNAAMCLGVGFIATVLGILINLKRI